jgi:hypothetical protein
MHRMNGREKTYPGILNSSTRPSHTMSAGSHALPRLWTLGTNAKHPRERELLLGNAPVRAKPTAQQRPEACPGMLMDCRHAGALCGARPCALAMRPTLRRVKTVLGWTNPWTWRQRLVAARLEGLWLPVRHQAEPHLPTPLAPPQDGGPLRRPGPTPRLAWAWPVTSWAARVLPLPPEGLSGRPSPTLPRPRLPARGAPWAFCDDPSPQLGRPRLPSTARPRPCVGQRRMRERQAQNIETQPPACQRLRMARTNRVHALITA